MYGLEVINDSSRVLVSSNTSTASFVGKAAFSSYYLSGYSDCELHVQVFTVTGCPHFPIPFVRLTSGYFRPKSVKATSSDSWEIEFLTSFSDYSANGMEVYVFTATTARSAPDNYGIAVYNSNGAMTFHSGYKLLNPRGIKTSLSPGNNAHNVSGMSKPALMVASGAYFDGSTLLGGVVYCGSFICHRIDGTYIYCKEYGSGSTGNPGSGVSGIFPFIDGADYD